jgi:hypothetical protein
MAPAVIKMGASTHEHDEMVAAQITVPAISIAAMLTITINGTVTARASDDGSVQQPRVGVHRWSETCNNDSYACARLRRHTQRARGRTGF